MPSCPVCPARGFPVPLSVWCFLPVSLQQSPAPLCSVSTPYSVPADPQHQSSAETAQERAVHRSLRSWLCDPAGSGSVLMPDIFSDSGRVFGSCRKHARMAVQPLQISACRRPVILHSSHMLASGAKTHQKRRCKRQQGMPKHCGKVLLPP